MTRPLDPLSFPLAGSHLIEASAGTGKTFTLAALYLRLVLGHGGEQGFSRPLLPPEILVVTFTEAATRELRDRIRQRLAAAARYFAGLDEHAADPFLQRLRDSIDSSQRAFHAAQLRAAAQWMDDAAIYTIHGFCQRMLRQHAFDSGSLFSLDLTEDEEQLLATAVNDYWRTWFMGLDTEQAHGLAQTFSDPSALLSAVRHLLPVSRALSTGDDDPVTLLQTWIEQRNSQLAALKARWLDWAGELLEQFEAAWDSGAIKAGGPPRRQDVRNWLQAIIGWCQQPDNERSPFNKEAKVFERMRVDTLAALPSTPPALLAHPALDRFNELKAPDQDLPQLAPRLLPHACLWVADRIAASKHQQALIGFDDMLTHLHAALAGDNGAALAQQIRQQYPFALIDEFQDTDPTQYGIFRYIYGEQPDTGWLMIGDPKQAIYSFRGADIYTYLQARQHTRGRHHTLTTNYRSAKALVAAINQVFERAQQRPQGAFLLADDVPFVPVDANGRAEQLEIDGATHAPLTFWHLQKAADERDRSFSKGAYVSAMATAAAARISQLLALAAEGRAGFRHEDQLVPIAPADIAVLVRDRSEAGAIRDALQALGLPSVYLSDRDNVFGSDEAADLLQWLRACAEPENEQRLRAALATATLALNWQDLHALVDDEARWEDTAERFIHYRSLWRQRGVLAMTRQLLRDFDVPARLLAQANGERTLTNLLHLGELLQQAASVLDGEQALVRYLIDEMDGSAGANTADEQILRLESDAGLIKVITMHKSKGLEYPLVFIPFPCVYREVDPGRPPLRYHDDSGTLQVALQADDALVARADGERLAEDLRLIYVAMTRARHACWLGIAAMRKGNSHNVCELHRSAIGQLLGASDNTGVDDIPALLAQLDHPHIAVAAAPEMDSAVQLRVQTTGQPGPARTFSGQVASHWWIASYSALNKVSEEQAPDSPRDARVREESRQAPASPQADTFDAHGFPRGPLPGTFLHELLEWGAEAGFAQCHADNPDWRTLVAQRCSARRWQPWQDVLVHWLQAITHQPLPVNGKPLVLADVPADALQAEMEFWLPAHQVDVRALDRLVSAHTLAGRARTALVAEQLNGMLKGFIDLVLQHDGRYYVLDYKSNWLGPDTHSYADDNLAQAVLEGRYDMQYCLYLLALHRLLRARLGERYDYDKHVGGSLYLFLRGIGHDSAGLFQEKPPRALIDAMDRLFRGEQP